MHVHDPRSSVLEMWLLDRGVEGVIPLSMRGVFGGLGGHALVGTSSVFLSQVAFGLETFFLFRTTRSRVLSSLPLTPTEHHGNPSSFSEIAVDF